MDEAPKNPWKEAVIDALIIGHIYREKHENEPRQALADLIHWEISVALDPAVSSAARDLMERGKQGGLPQTVGVKADGDGSVWLNITAPSGRKASFRIDELARENTIARSVLLEWADQQREGQCRS